MFWFIDIQHIWDNWMGDRLGTNLDSTIMTNVQGSTSL